MDLGSPDRAQHEDGPSGGKDRPVADALGDLARDDGGGRGDEQREAGEGEGDLGGLTDVLDDEERQVGKDGVNSELVDEQRREVTHRRGLSRDRAEVAAPAVVLLAGHQLAAFLDT